MTNFTKVQHAFSPYGDSQTVALASAAGSTDNRLFFATAQRSGASWGTYSFTDDNGGTWTRVLEQDFDLTDDAIDRRSFAAYVRQVIAADLTTAPSVSSIAAAANPSMQSVLIEFSADAAFDWTLAAEEAIGNTADDTEASSFALGSTGDPGGSDNFVIAFGILKRNTVAITSMEFDLSGGANVSLDGGSFGINLCVEWSAAGLAGAQSLTHSWAGENLVGSAGVSIFTTEAAGGGTPVGLAAETDTALAVSPARGVDLGLAAGTDAALGVTIARVRAVGLASASDTALGLAIARGIDLGLASEADAALALGTRLVVDIGLAAETDAALAATIARAAALGLAGESDTAAAVASARILALALAIETDTALALATWLAPSPMPRVVAITDFTRVAAVVDPGRTVTIN